MSNISVVLYHKDCLDGLMAAYAVWEKAKSTTLCIPITYPEFEKQTPDEFMEMCFNDKLPTAVISSSFSFGFSMLMKKAKTEVTAYLVDISVPKEILRRISETFRSVVVLDHHESANTIYKNDSEFETTITTDNLTGYVFNKNVRIFMDSVNSGAYLAWRYMNPNEREVPYPVQLVSEYDTWNKKDKNADYFAAGFRAKNCRSLKGVDYVFNNVNETIELGVVMDKERENRSRAAIAKRVEIDIRHNGEVYKAAIVNSNMDLSSIIGMNLCADHGYDIGLTYTIVGDNKVAWSIRSSKPTSCLFVATHFGGGGHAQACGFGTDFNYLIALLRSKAMII